MVATKNEIAAGGGANGHGLPGSATDARILAVLGGIKVRQRPDAASAEPKKSFLIPRIVTESPERSRTVVGWSSFGKSRLR